MHLDGGNRMNSFGAIVGTWAAGSAGRQFTSIALPSGLVFGVIEGANNGSVAGGIAEGLFFGIFFGGFVTWRTEQLLGKTQVARHDRQAVYRVVMRGDPLTEPRMAQAVVEYVAMLRKRQGRFRTAVLVLAVIAVGCGIFDAGAVHARHWAQVAVWSVLFFLVALRGVTFPRSFERLQRQMAEAESEAHRSMASG